MSNQLNDRPADLARAWLAEGLGPVFVAGLNDQQIRVAARGLIEGLRTRPDITNSADFDTWMHQDETMVAREEPVLDNIKVEKEEDDVKIGIKEVTDSETEPESQPEVGSSTARRMTREEEKEARNAAKRPLKNAKKYARTKAERQRKATERRDRRAWKYAFSSELMLVKMRCHRVEL